MAWKQEKPEEIVSKLWQVEVLHGQGMMIADALRQIGLTEQTFYRWRKLYVGMGWSQLKRLKELEKVNQRLRRAVSDLTLDKLILTEAARGNFWAFRVVASASIMYGSSWMCLSVVPAAPWGSTVRHKERFRKAVLMKSGWLTIS